MQCDFDVMGCHNLKKKPMNLCVTESLLFVDLKGLLRVLQCLFLFIYLFFFFAYETRQICFYDSLLC